MAEQSSSRARRHAESRRPSGPDVAREERLASLLGRLARRASTWGWRSTYDKVRRGEPVPRWHKRMMELTAAKRSGDFRPPPGADDGQD